MIAAVLALITAVLAPLVHLWDERERRRSWDAHVAAALDLTETDRD